MHNGRCRRKVNPKRKSRRDVHDLPGVHQPMRVQCSLDASHHTDRLEAQFLDQEFLFPEAYAMFALDSSISLNKK